MDKLLIYLLVGIVIGLFMATRVAGSRRSGRGRSKSNKRTKRHGSKTMKSVKRFFVNSIAVVIFVGIAAGILLALSGCAVDEQTQAQRLVEQAGYSQVEFYAQPLIDFCEVGETYAFTAIDGAGSPARVSVCNGSVRRID